MKAAEEMLKLVGLTKQMHHKPTQMSGGQQQRIGVARALVVDPKIILQMSRRATWTPGLPRRSWS